MSAEIPAHPQITETKIPEKNWIEESVTFIERQKKLGEYLEKRQIPLFSRLFNKVKNLVSHPSKLKHRSEQDAPAEQSSERSVLTRSLRKTLYETFMATPKEDTETRQEIIEAGHEMDRYGKEFLQQSEVSVDFGEELGVQTSRYTILRAPESKRHLNLSPVVLVPGISNDLNPIGNLAQALSESGRDVLVIGYPESTLGTVTKKFAKTCKKEKNFENHATYFKGAIAEIKRRGDVNLDSFELWSHSAGGPIAAEMLQDEWFKPQVENAVFLAPAAAEKQSALQMLGGLIQEIRHDIKPERRSLLARYSLVFGNKKDHTMPSKGKSGVLNSLLTAIRNKYEHWDTATAREGGKTIFFSGDLDTLTKTAKNTQLGRAENQTRIDDPEASHLTALVQPRETIKKVYRVLHPEVDLDFLLE